jgi:hypothetical protein
MNEARAFAAGYGMAIRLLMRRPNEASALAILREAADRVPNWFESWQILQDPEFLESLEQMKRGEGRVIEPGEFEN